MFTQAFWTSLRILIFRAGPADMPFDNGRKLTFACIAIAFIVNVLAASVALPISVGVFAALAIIGSYAFTARSALTRRALMNRFQQTFNALLLTNALLTLALLPALAQIAPIVIAFIHEVQQNPDIANDPERWPKISGAVEFWADAIFLWQFAVSVFVFKRATDTSVLVGVLFVLLLFLVTLGLNFFASLLAAMTMS